MTARLEQFSFLFAQDGGYLRIPIWGHIPLSLGARRILEHPDFVRLQGIRQLGFVYYVFPGATHTRFEHSVGTYHLAVLMLQRLVINPDNWFDAQTPKITPDEARLFLASALLHDIGHYPFAHLVDRLPADPPFKTHEEAAKDLLKYEFSDILRDEWQVSAEDVMNVIANPNDSGLPGRMLSGILDPDKMDYLMRDAAACAVPYGNIDTDRLIESLVLDVEGPIRRLAITEKGVAPLESLIFAKYMMFRHIYWHHTVRTAAAMFTRYIQDALEQPEFLIDSFYPSTDDALIYELRSRPHPQSADLICGLQARLLYKRGLTFHPERASGDDEFAVAGEDFERIKGLYFNPNLRKEKEIAICRMLSDKEGLDLNGHEVLLDIPRLESVFDLEDFRQLRVQVKFSSTGQTRFVPFNSYGFTQLTADFVEEFERFSRRVQVICRPDLREAVVRRWREIKAIVLNRE